MLCMARLTGLLLLTPIISGFSIPSRVRLLIVIGLSICLAHIHSGEGQILLDGTLPLIVLCVTEFLLGVLMAFGIFSAFAVFSMAGRLLDLQIGFSVASLIDPVTKQQSPVLASMLDLLAILIFFVGNFHHALIRGFSASLNYVPLGQVLLNFNPVLLGKRIGIMFSQGFALAAPVAFFLLFIEFGMAVLSRNIPQLNIFIISMPIKIIGGLFMLSLAVHYFGPAAFVIFNDIFNYWEDLLV